MARVSSRITTMNYAYKIMFSKKYMVSESVIEYDNQSYLYTWMTHELKDGTSRFNFTSSVSAKESFARTRKWIIDNHPELFL